MVKKKAHHSLIKGAVVKVIACLFLRKLEMVLQNPKIQEKGKESNGYKVSTR